VIELSRTFCFATQILLTERFVDAQHKSKAEEHKTTFAAKNVLI
jgi:hypothetical protein